MSKASYENFKEDINWNIEIYLKESKGIQISSEEDKNIEIRKIENKISKIESNWSQMQIESIKIKEIRSIVRKNKLSQLHRPL